MPKIKGKNVYQFKIILKGSKPPVWRRILISEDSTFWDLHVAIQDAMGWADYHLHEFSVINHTTQDWEFIAVPHAEDFRPVIDETKEKIADWLGTKVKQCNYIYDFGDGWDHTVLFEKTIPADEKKSYPICVKGKMACPPEDCGGIWGYREICDGTHEAQEEYSFFDPFDFSIEKIEFDNPKKRLKDYLESQDY